MMFLQDTVLVLGAGSSVHCGYPTGDRLINNIKWMLGTDRLFFNREFQVALCKLAAPWQELLEALEFFDPLSIDSFLEQNHENTNLVTYGKRMIITEILANEHPDKLLAKAIEPKQFSSQEKSGNWYRFLWHALIAQIRTDEDRISQLLASAKKLKIITFNYDVSLDYYLYTRIHGIGFLKPDQKAALWAIIENSFVHIYGKVDRGTNYRDYGTLFADGANGTSQDHATKRTTAWNLAQAQEGNIHIMGKDRKNKAVSDNVTKAKDWLKNAQKIFFLGYGFNEDNNSLLELNESCSRGKKFLTNYGNSARVDSIVSSLFPNRGETQAGKPICTISDKSVYEALEHELPLI